MEKIILGSFLFLFAFQMSDGFRIQGNELSSSKNIDLVKGLRNLCKCRNLECSCCLTIFRKKACSSMGLIEERNSEGKQTFSIEIKVTISNKNLFSKRFPVANIPPFCYGIFGVKLCAKISFRREMEDIKICGSLQLLILHKVLHEYDLYCIRIPFHKQINVTSIEGIPQLERLLSLSVHEESDAPSFIRISKVEDISTFTISTGSPLHIPNSKLWKGYYLPLVKDEFRHKRFSYYQNTP